MVSDNGYSLLELPKWFLILRIAQFIFSVIALGLAGYGANVFNGLYGVALDSEGLTIFTAIATWIILAYIIGSSMFMKQLYNYWAVIACEAFLVIFWLASMADCANFAAATSILNGINPGYSGPYSNYLHARDSVAAAAGMSAIEFVLFIVSLVFTGLAVNRHMKSAGGATNTTSMAMGDNVAEHKPEEYQQQPVPPQGASASGYPQYGEQNPYGQPQPTY